MLECGTLQYCYTVEPSLKSVCNCDFDVERSSWDDHDIDKHPGVYAAVQDFLQTEEGRQLKVGPVKKRYSRTVADSYLSHGCYYCDDFFKPKVMWKIIGCNINFSFNDGTMICNNAVNIMTGQRNQLLQFLGLMNCKLFDWYLKLTTEAEVQGGGIQLYVTTLEKTLVKLDFPMYLSEVINQRVNGIATDTDVDNIIFEAYKLTQEEIDYILSCKQVDR